LFINVFEVFQHQQMTHKQSAAILNSWLHDLFPGSILYICCIILAKYVHPRRPNSRCSKSKMAVAT